MNKQNIYLYSIVLVAVLGGLLFGYDTAVISGAEKGLEAFFLTAKDFEYNKILHGITSASGIIGCIIGGATSGIFARRLGRRNSLRLASLLFLLSAFGSFCPEFLFFERGDASLSLFYAFNIYRIIGGIGVGLASAICPMYIAEIAPSNIRGMLVSWNQFAIIFGMLIVYFVNFMIMGGHSNPIIDVDQITGAMSVNLESDLWSVTTGWRLMFATEAIPASIFGISLCFIPKTPRYLMLMGESDRAMEVLQRINGREIAEKIFNNIKSTLRESNEPILAYGVRVIIIGILLSVFQQVIGIAAVLYYAPRIFEGAGAEGGGMMQTVIMGVVNIIFTLIAIFSVDKVGRKPLLIIGSLGMAIGAGGVAICDTMGIVGVVPVLFIILYTALFMMSWGPICWVMIAEIFPTSIRGKAVAIAVAAQWLFNFCVSSSFPALYNFSPFFAYGIYSVMAIISAIFVWKMVPETNGKSLEEMTQLWNRQQTKIDNN